MPIAQNTQLYKLVKSLKKSEKRHFKLYVNRLESNKNVMFIQLFDKIDRSNKLDESSINGLFPNLKSTEFANLKRHLYSQILKSLRLLHTRHDVDIQVREQLDYAKILYSKGLYLQALKLLERILSIAKKSSQEIIGLEILEFQKMIESRHITRSRTVKNKMESLIEQSADFNITVSRTSDISNLSLMIQGLYIKMGFVKNEKERFLVDQYFQSNLPKVFSKKPGFYEEVLLQQSWVWYYYMCLEYEKSLEHAINWVNVFEENIIMQQKDPDLYIRGVHYILTNAYYLKDESSFTEWMKIYQKFIKKNNEKFNDKTLQLNFIYESNAKLNYSLLKQDYKSGMKMVEEISRLVPKFRLKLDSHRIIMFNYKFAMISILGQNFEKAIDFINRILFLKKEYLRADITAYAKLLNLISNYHLGNYILIKNLSPSVRKALDKQGEMNNALVQVFAFVNKRPVKNQIKSDLEKLKLKIESARHDKFDKRIFNYFNFRTWVSILEKNYAKLKY